MISTDWQYERAMSPRAYERTIAALGLNVASSGRFLGVSERTARRYSSGDAEIPVAAILLLRACMAYKIPLVVPKKAPRN